MYIEYLDDNCYKSFLSKKVALETDKIVINRYLQDSVFAFYKNNNDSILVYSFHDYYIKSHIAHVLEDKDQFDWVQHVYKNLRKDKAKEYKDYWNGIIESKIEDCKAQLKTLKGQILPEKDNSNKNEKE